MCLAEERERRHLGAQHAELLRVPLPRGDQVGQERERRDDERVVAQHAEHPPLHPHQVARLEVPGRQACEPPRRERRLVRVAHLGGDERRRRADELEQRARDGQARLRQERVDEVRGHEDELGVELELPRGAPLRRRAW